MRTTTSEAPSERHSRMTLGRAERVTDVGSSDPRVCAADGVRVRRHVVTHRGTVTGRAHQPPDRTKHTAARPPDHAPPPAFRQMASVFPALAGVSFCGLCCSLPRRETPDAGREQLLGLGRGMAAEGVGECQRAEWDERARSADRRYPVSLWPEWRNALAIVEPDAATQWRRTLSHRRQGRL